jgi:hypothetical protein
MQLYNRNLNLNSFGCSKFHILLALDVYAMDHLCQIWLLALVILFDVYQGSMKLW